MQYLDVRHLVQAMRLFMPQREQGRTTMMALYDMLWVQRCCDQMLLMFPNGTVLQGGAEEPLTCSHLEALYQCQLYVQEAGGERYFVPGV